MTELQRDNLLSLATYNATPLLPLSPPGHIVGDNQPGDVQSNGIADFFPFCIQFSAETSEV